MIINGINFQELEAEKYWSFTKACKNPKLEARNMVLSGDYLGARKMDGAYYRFIKDMDGNMRLQGRSRSVSGEYLNKLGHVPQLHEYFSRLPNGTCLLGEIYFPNNEGSSNVTTIMGCLTDKAIARQEKGDKLHYYIFDVWAYNGRSMLKESIEDRISVLYMLKPDDYVEIATYYSDGELWNQLQEILADDGEGVVITRKGSHPEPGKRTARKTLKIKKELQDSIDVTIIGANPPTRLYTGKDIDSWRLWEDTITGEKLNGEHYFEYQNGAPIQPITKTYYNGWAGSLKIGMLKDGHMTEIGSLSGLTEEVLKNWRDYIGKVASITCMEILPTGGLRHPRFVIWRPDLTPNDTDWYRIFGE